MKKILITILLIFIVLPILLSPKNYAVDIKEETLENALNNLSQYEGFDQNTKISMDKTNKKINFSTQNSENNIINYTINYDLSDKPTFSVETTIGNSTTYEQWVEKQAELLSPVILYVPIASINGVSEDDSLFYMLEKILVDISKHITPSSYKIEETNDIVKITDKDGNNIPVSEFPKHAIEITKDYYNKDIIITDSDSANTFKLISKIKEISETSCTLQTVFTLNSNGDFSKVSGYIDNTTNEMSNSIVSSLNNSVNIYHNMLIEEQEALNKTQEKLNEIINNSNKLPQTGNFFEFKDTLILISIVSSILLVIIILKDIKYKNINNK